MEQLAEPEVTSTTAAHEPALQPGVCQRCGAHGAKRAEFMRVMSFIVVTRHWRYEGQLCPSCTALVGMKELSISSALGWWGFPWGLMTLQALWINGKSLLGSNHAGRIGAAAVLSGIVWCGSALVRHGVAQQQERADAERTGDWVDDKTAEEFNRATALCDAGQFEAALAPIRRAYESAPHSSAINAVYGYIEMSLGHPDKARPRLEAAVRKDPEDFDSLNMLAAAHLQLGEPEKGAKYLEQYLARSGDDDVAMHEQYQGAMLASGQHDEVVATYRQRAQREPQSAQAQYLLGRLMGEPDESAPLLRRALELDPNLQCAREHLIYALLGQRELEEAAAECDKFVPAFPEDPTDALLAGMVAFSSRDFGGALAALDSAIAAGKDNPMLRFQRAQYAAAALRYDDARDDLNLARIGAALDPSFQLLLTTFEIALLIEEGHLPEAEARCAAARKDHADAGEEAALELAWMDGLIAWQGGNLADAARAFDAAPQIEEPTMSWRTPRLARGMVLALQGDLGAARADWEQVAGASADGEDWEQVPTAQLLLGQLAPEDYLARVRRSTPTFDNNAYFAVGLHHELAGRVDEAREAYQQAVTTSFGHNHPYGLAIAALERLAEGR
jgi:tetratricopeptide (TPR) repeat protein